MAGLLASIGLLVASMAELLVSGYSCLTLTPKLCGCLRASATTTDETASDGHLKTRNMVHQWVIAQNHVPSKNQPIYVVQPMMPMHPMIQVSETRADFLLPRPPTAATFPVVVGREEGGRVDRRVTRGQGDRSVTRARKFKPIAPIATRISPGASRGTRGFIVGPAVSYPRYGCRGNSLPR